METGKLIEAVQNEHGSAFENCRECTYGVNNNEVVSALKRLLDYENGVQVAQSKFKVGDAVLFINGYGTTYSGKMYRWGELKLGFITQVEHIKNDLPLYVIGHQSPLDATRPVYRTLGEHMLFTTEEKSIAIERLNDLCAEPEVY